MSRIEKEPGIGRQLFASAIDLREGAQALLALGGQNQYVQSVAVLCHQSAERMMCAYISLNGIHVEAGEDSTYDLWNLCRNHNPELEEAEIDAEALVDCGWVDFPQDSKTIQKAIESAIRLEKAMLQAAPGLASGYGHTDNMEMKM